MRKYLLYMHGGSNNHGCEAIVRGTVEILGHSFAEPRFKVLSLFKTDEQFENQKNLKMTVESSTGE
jgi:colanic acid/amylovoran biosynthesis protein